MSIPIYDSATKSYKQETVENPFTTSKGVIDYVES
jgi:hypothetical protein